MIKQQTRASAYHLKPAEIKKLIIAASNFRRSIVRFLKSKGFSAEWIQNFLGYQSFKTTMDMYGTISIDEMQEVAEKKLSE